MDSTPPAPFSIRTDGVGGQVVVAGVDVSAHVSGLRLDMAHAHPARLTLFGVPGAGTIEGVAVVEQVPADGPEAPAERDPMEDLAVAAAVVRSVDPVLLDAALRARPTRLTENAAAVMLEVLAALLDDVATVDGALAAGGT